MKKPYFEIENTTYAGWVVLAMGLIGQYIVKGGFLKRIDAKRHSLKLCKELKAIRDRETSLVESFFMP